MCGIAGYIGKKKLDSSVIEPTLALMHRRGPDGKGHASFNKGGIQVELLHTRLSIIDLNPRSAQPFTLDGCTLVFNGEIYNYLELRDKMALPADEWLTTSDTEVLLRYYLRHGEDCVKHFEGMWSFAIYDTRKGSLFLSRDRFAEKPLYTHRSADGLYFASEIKFLKSLSQKSFPVNTRHLQRYLVNGYKSLCKTTDTYFEEVREVPYASAITVSPNLEVVERKYWHPEFQPVEMSLEQAIEGFREKMIQGVGRRLRSDVPIAFCLSGGIDSSAIVAIAAKHFKYDVETFSIIDSDPRYNEESNIRKTVSHLGCRANFFPTTQKDFIPQLTTQVDYHDSPISTISYYVHAFLSKAIAEKGYKVVCSGTGADELVTGYYDHFNLYMAELTNPRDQQAYREEWSKTIGAIVRNPWLKNIDLYLQQPDCREHVYLQRDEFRTFLRDDALNETFSETRFCDSLLRNRMLNELFHEAVPVILKEDDMNSMYYSLENRSPFLDRDLFDFCASIPSRHLIQKGLGKYILRMSLAGLVPDEVRLDHKKVGFNASIQSLFDNSNPKSRKWLLADSPLFDLVRRDKVEQLIDMREFENSMSKFLFSLINCKIFLELNSSSYTAK